jgi:cob(I)alamin adenosyltransferase
MKLYTRTGDDGHTGLFGGQRVEKDALRVEAYGTVDELNATLGLALAAAPHPELGDLLTRLQSRLFDLGSDLACPRPAQEAGDILEGKRINDNDITGLERDIDAVSEALPPMRHFILPGGTELSARLHHARTVCRRAERLCFRLSRNEYVGDHVTVFLNRLSDLLFAMARRANQLNGVEDVPWIGRKGS